MIDQLLLVIGLLVVGYILLALELMVIPGFGVAGIGGLACLGIGSYYAVRYLGSFTGGLVVGGVIILPTVLLVGLPRTRYGRAIIHRQSLEGATAGGTTLVPGLQGMAESDLRPAGIARFGELRESVVTEGDYIAAGTPVQVMQVEGGRIVVEGCVPGTAGTEASDLSDARPPAGGPEEGDS